MHKVSSCNTVYLELGERAGYSRDRVGTSTNTCKNKNIELYYKVKKEVYHAVHKLTRQFNTSHYHSHTKERAYNALFIYKTF